MTKEEKLIRQRHEDVYRPMVDAFFKKCEEDGYTDSELSGIPSLFLPACGSLYATSLVKLAIIGQETYGWLSGLDKDRQAWRKGAFNAQASFDVFQDEGPSSWRNRFWGYHFSVLEKVYERSGLLNDHNAVLDGIAWSNRFAIEQKTSEEKGIKKGTINRLRSHSFELSKFDAFIHVFKPDVILYSCHNNAMGSDAVLRSCAAMEPVRECEDFKIWTWKMGNTWIFQTWHPSYLRRKSVSMESFAAAIREEMIKRKVFAPIGAKKHYDAAADAQIPIFARHLNIEATRIEASLPGIGDKELSYRLLGALALELIKQHATMTARRGVLLLNEIDRFKSRGGRFSPKGRGPCNVAEAAYRYFATRNTKEDNVLADAVATAFTTVWGTYAYA